ncbi:MacB family efflux pump subunit [Methylosinus sp. LW4]|uniref:MacB family efflux pump subunit n=1 Tax=Methylosinus sp. LW4 TaxID=136993 RepID=UPI0003613BF8|nr:MacB family efflux pump subunit [Methylosinus sp. LW4]
MGATIRASLLELRGAKRRYAAGAQEIYALRGIDLDIREGEMVALVGASGSGKSTLMNILGCLDRLSDGSYRVAGRDTSTLVPDQLAELRRAHFGFVFQRYNLLPQLSARANVEIPAIYVGMEAKQRHQRARVLLERLGLEERLDHRPNQLSGGQQQRVSIARALMNGGQVILADEPTGALDSATGAEVMKLLLDLNRLGHTLILATHDPVVAAHAQRIITVADGRIVSDVMKDAAEGVVSRPATAGVETSREAAAGPGVAAPAEQTDERPRSATPSREGVWPRFLDAGHMAVVALLGHRLRTALTLLGVVIGIVSVVTMVALGEAAQRFIADDLKGVRTNTLEIYPGKDWGDPDATRIQTLTSADVEALRRQDYVEDASPQMAQSALLRHRASSGSASVTGVGVNYFEMTGLPIAQGAGFNRDDISRQAQVVVIDANVRLRFFGSANPIGQTLYVGKLPCVIVGVTGRNYQQESRGGSKLNVWVPHTTAGARLIGRSYLDSIVVALRDGEPPAVAEEKMTPFLTRRHRVKDFVVFNLAERIRSGLAFFNSMSLLLAAIGVISLTVGGIGVMNIMLVSVSERAREIGVRIAVGARQGDIRRQFLIEAVVVCLVGAAIGVALSYLACWGVGYFLPPKWELRLSLSAILSAVVCATATGIIFGYFPARSAARLDPVEALARD